MIIEPDNYLIERKDFTELNSFLHSTQIEVGEHAREFTSSKYFSSSNKAEKLNVKLVSFEKDLFIKDILAEIDKAGYKLPEAQDAIWFGLKYPEIQSKYPIAFLHKPWINPKTEGESVLILRNYGGKDFLHMHLFDSRWYSHIRFLVVC
jgi:hypothetical protein